MQNLWWSSGRMSDGAQLKVTPDPPTRPTALTTAPPPGGAFNLNSNSGTNGHLGVKLGDLLLVHAGPPVDSALVAELSEDKPLETSGGRPEVRIQGRWYLQGRDALADWLGVFPQDALLVQEPAVLAVPGWLEEAVVQDILQGLVECAQDPLLGRPHRGVRVETHAFLVEDGDSDGYGVI